MIRTPPFFVIDGIDGCGKSTQTKLLTEALLQKGFSVTSVRDPGATAISEQIRKVILSTENEKMSPKTELFLYSAARMQLIEEILKPRRLAGDVIISDRYATSTIAYQAYGGGLPLDLVSTVIEACIRDFLPTLTMIIDVPLEVAETRIDAVRDRLELKNMDFKKRVREGFIQQAAQKNNIIVMDGKQTVDQIHRQIMDVVNEFL